MTSSLLLCAVIALSCTTTQAASEPSTRTVIVDGREVPAEDVARSLTDDANAAALAHDDAKAKALFTRVTVEFADTVSFGAATVGLARLLLDEKDGKGAQAVLEKLLLEEPTSTVADDARYLLALSQLEQGNASAAAPTLKTLVEKIPEEQRAEAYRDLGQKLAAEGHGTEAVRYLSRALANASGAEKKALEEQLVRTLDADVPFNDVRLLLETEAKPNTLLDEAATMKLARVHVHLRHFADADQMVARYLERYPKGRWAAQATELRQAMAARVDVDAKAVGVLLPLSGEYAAYGKRALSAVKIGFGVPVRGEAPPAEPQLDPATGEVIAPSEKPAKKNLEETLTAPNGLKIIVRDTRGDPARAAELVQELVEKHRVVGILGDILLDTSQPIALAAEEHGVPMLSLSRRGGVPETGPWSFRLGLTAKKQAEALARLAVDGLGMKRFAIMYPKHAFGVELMNEFWDELDRRKAEVTAVESYAHDQTTFTGEARSLVGRGMAASSEVIQCRQEADQISNDYRRRKTKEGCNDLARPIVDFEALFIPDSYRSVSYVIPALVAEDVLVTNDRRTVEAYRKTTGNNSVRPVQLLGVSMWNDPELAKRLGRQIDGAVLVDGFDVGDGSPRVQRFVGAFVGAHGSRPALVEAQAHDGAALFSALLAPTEGTPTPRTREGLRALLGSVKDFPGVTGLIRFDEHGDSATEPRYFIVDGENLERRELRTLVGKGDAG